MCPQGPPSTPTPLRAPAVTTLRSSLRSSKPSGCGSRGRPLRPLCVCAALEPSPTAGGCRGPAWGRECPSSWFLTLSPPGQDPQTACRRLPPLCLSLNHLQFCDWSQCVPFWSLWVWAGLEPAGDLCSPSCPAQGSSPWPAPSQASLGGAGDCSHLCRKEGGLPAQRRTGAGRRTPALLHS